MAIPEGGVQPHNPQHNAKARLGLILGGGVVGVFLLMRGLGGGSSAGASQSDIAAAQQAQQAADQALYGQTGATGVSDNSASNAQLDTDITSALGGVQTALDNFTNAQQQAPPIDTTSTGGSDLTTVAGLLGQAITALGNGQHTTQQSAPSASPGATSTPTKPATGAGAGGGGVIQSGSWEPAALTTAGGLAFGSGGGDFLNSLKAKGYKQTVRGFEGVGGTYAKAGAPTYFVFGGKSGQPFRIRQAK